MISVFRLVFWSVFAVPIVVLIGCADTGPSAVIDGGGRAPGEVSYAVAPSAAQLEELETAVLKNGHQPWRLDPVSTARYALRALPADDRAAASRHREAVRNVGDASYTVDTQGGTSVVWRRDSVLVIVDVRNTRSAGDGIWYATRIGMRHLE